MTTRRERLFWLAILMIPMFFLVSLAVNTWREADWTADQSALAALDKEIADQLAAIPPGQPYPASLSELSLTYPDGGDDSLLSRFEYTSTGDRCQYRVTIFDEEVVRSFPIGQ